jgi:hypothetical protein
VSENIRLDMQKLNDLYTHERSSHADSRHASSLLEQELVRMQQDNMLLKRDADKVSSIKSKNKVIMGTHSLTDSRSHSLTSSFYF